MGYWECIESCIVYFFFLNDKEGKWFWEKFLMKVFFIGMVSCKFGGCFYCVCMKYGFDMFLSYC